MSPILEYQLPTPRPRGNLIVFALVYLLSEIAGTVCGGRAIDWDFGTRQSQEYALMGIMMMPAGLFVIVMIWVIWGRHLRLRVWGAALVGVLTPAMGMAAAVGIRWLMGQ